MIFKRKSIPVFLFRVALSLLICPESGIAAENSAPRDIAIADLANISGNPNLDPYRQSIPETIFTELAFSQKISLVERSRLEDAIHEMGFAEIGITDPSAAAKVGKAVGARHIFVGTLAEFKEEHVVVVNTRLIEVESARIISGWNERAPLHRLSQVPFDLAKEILRQLFPDAPVVAALKSTIIPGWGQLSNDRSTGYLFIVGGLASVGGLVAAQISLTNAKDVLEERRNPNIPSSGPISVEELDRLAKAFDDASEDVKEKRNQRKIAAIVVGTVWGLNVLDAYIGNHLLRKSRERTVQKALAFEPTPNLQGIVMRVRF